MIARALPILSCALLGCAAAAQSLSPLEVLKRYYTNRGKVPCVLVQNYTGEKSVTRMKYVSDGEGNMVWRVIQPLADEGKSTYVTPEWLIAIDPARKQIFKMESPVLGRFSPTRVSKLMSANYKLSHEPMTTIAGRPAYHVKAVPKAAGLPTKQFYVDKELFMLLKVDNEVAGRPFGTSMEVISCRPDEDVEIDLPDENDPDWKVIEQWGPVFIKAIDEDVADELDFQPVAPKTLGMGFELEAMFLAGKEHAPYLQLRYTDGLTLVSVMVAQNSRDSKQFPFRTAVASGSIKAAIEGDIPSGIANKLIRTYLAAKR